MGARPMARLIQDTIRRALADELLFGKLANGGKVTVDVDDAEQDHAAVRAIRAGFPAGGEGAGRLKQRRRRRRGYRTISNIRPRLA